MGKQNFIKVMKLYFTQRYKYLYIMSTIEAIEHLMHLSCLNSDCCAQSSYQFQHCLFASWQQIHHNQSFHPKTKDINIIMKHNFTRGCTNFNSINIYMQQRIIHVKQLELRHLIFKEYLRYSIFHKYNIFDKKKHLMNRSSIGSNCLVHTSAWCETLLAKQEPEDILKEKIQNSLFHCLYQDIIAPTEYSKQ